MQKSNSIINNQRGSIISMALIFLVLLTVIGITATNTSTTEVQVSTNAVLHNVAFYAADSGVAAGRAALNNIKIADKGAWQNLLFNIDPPAGKAKKSVQWNDPDCVDQPCDCTLPDIPEYPNNPLCYTLNDIMDAEKEYWLSKDVPHKGRTVGLATFTLELEDNEDLDGDLATDSDDTVILTSTSTFTDPNRNATATIRTTVRGGGEDDAQEHYNAGSSGHAIAESVAAATEKRIDG